MSQNFDANEQAASTANNVRRGPDTMFRSTQPVDAEAAVIATPVASACGDRIEQSLRRFPVRWSDVMLPAAFSASVILVILLFFNTQIGRAHV